MNFELGFYSNPAPEKNTIFCIQKYLNMALLSKESITERSLYVGKNKENREEKKKWERKAMTIREEMQNPDR